MLRQAKTEDTNSGTPNQEIPRNITRYQEILRSNKNFHENCMRNKINAQPGKKMDTASGTSDQEISRNTTRD